MVSRKQVPGFASHVASGTDEHFSWAEGWFTFRAGHLKQQYLADGAGIPAEGAGADLCSLETATGPKGTA